MEVRTWSPKPELRQTTTHPLVSFIFILLLSFAFQWPRIAAQNGTSSSSNDPPSPDQKSWVVGRSGNASWTDPSDLSLVQIPECTDFCLNVPDWRENQTILHLAVEMFPCKDSDDSLFKYSALARAITMWDPEHNINRCLDAGQYPSTAFTMEACNASSPSQQWYLLRDELRSGLLNTSAGLQGSAEPLSLQGYARRPEDWGKGWNNFGLSLASTSNDESSATVSSFSVVQHVSRGSASQQMIAPGTNQFSPGLIVNGDFERCGYDPEQGLVDFSGDIWWFEICSWTIWSGSVQLIRSNNMQTNPNGGSGVSLHLNGYGGPGSVSQLVFTEVGSNYSLSFDYGDASPWCGTGAKTMNLSISPSDFPEMAFSTNVTDSGRFAADMGWTGIAPLNFTAVGLSMNFTFYSTTQGTCGPVIDNVVVKLLSRASEGRGGRNGRVVRVVLVVVLSVCGVGFVALVAAILTRWMRTRKHPVEMGGFFSKGIRESSDTEGWDGGVQTRSLSFKGSYFDNQYSWEQLKAATGNFRNKLVIGDTKTVLYFAEFADGLLGAVKVDANQPLQQERQQQNHWSPHDAFKQEVALLQGLHHAHLVNLTGACIEGNQRALVFEYMPHGSLFDRLHGVEQSRQPVSWQVRMVIAYQVACALEYLHEEVNPPIIHRNVQASNVLLQRDDSAKLATFDLSRSGRPHAPSATESVANGSAASHGSYGHLDLAYRRTGKVSKKTDVYSYGALLFELITGCPAAELDSSLWADAFTQSAQVLKLVDPKLLGAFNGHELLEVIDVAVKCLKPDAKSRPSMSDVVFMLRASFS